MSLLTEAQRAKLLDNGRRQAAVKGTSGELDFEPVVKLFDPCGASTWLLVEIEPDFETIAWGLCDLGMGFPEFGTVSLEELAEHRGRFGIGIERDLNFEARGPISAYIRAADKAGRIVMDFGWRAAHRAERFASASLSCDYQTFRSWKNPPLLALGNDTVPPPSR